MNAEGSSTQEFDNFLEPIEREERCHYSCNNCAHGDPNSSCRAFSPQLLKFRQLAMSSGWREFDAPTGATTPYGSGAKHHLCITFLANLGSAHGGPSKVIGFAQFNSLLHMLLPARWSIILLMGTIYISDPTRRERHAAVHLL